MNVRFNAGATRVRFLWFAAVLLALVDYLAVYRPLERTIDATLSASEDIAVNLRRNEAVLLHRRQAEDERRRVAAAIQRYDLRSDRTITIAHFLREASRIAAHESVGVRSIDESLVGGTRGAAASMPSLEAIGLEMRLHGPYRNLLRVVRDLSADRIVMRIDVRSIEKQKDASGPVPALDATFDVSIERAVIRKPVVIPRVLRRPT